MIRRFAQILLVLGILVPAAGHAATPGRFCDGQGNQIYARGVPSTIYPTYRVFVAGLYRSCAAERGQVTVQQGSDSDIFRAILYRDGGVWQLDRPLSTDELAQIIPDVHPPFLFRTSPVHQIPLYGDGIAVGVNLACTKDPIKLRSSVLSLIYLGVISRWNDPLLLPDNPGLANCQVPVRVAIQATQDHYTSEFKQYLASRNREWIPYIAKGPDISWTPYTPKAPQPIWPPTLHSSCVGRGDAGMATCIAGFPGAIGYVSFEQAFRRGLHTAMVENSSSAFVGASTDACTTALATATAAFPPTTLADWSLAPLIDPAVGYPVCGITFGVVFQWGTRAYGGAVSIGQLRTVVDYLNTAISPASQKKLVRLGYARLPDNLVALSKAGIDMVSFGTV
ncbi:MAG: hypothetical protein NVSMB57_06210 [Actinomycetota bacterium]